MESLSLLDRDCSAIAGLFQIIVNDLKNSGPMWEDFLTKASKLQHVLKSTLVVFSSFLDAFQRIADSATHTRGATKDVGAALTRLSLRHRAIEARIKNLTNTLSTCLVIPLQEKLDEWRRTHHALDKEHTKEYKRARSDIKKRTENAARLQKKARKAGKHSELNKVVESTVGDLVARYGVLEETERTALRHALKEERARYCTFALALKPVLEEEVGLVTELAHIREVMEQLEKHSSDPHTLPAASEQVLEDVKSGDSKWSWQTPPSSPTSSLGSRKSSMCSISSLNSSSSSSSPSHHARPRSGLRLLNGSSQDSGFTSQDMLNRPMRPVSIAFQKASGLSETSCSDGTHTPSPATPATATWPNLATDSTLQHKSASATGLHMLTERPHTISSAYERGKERPPLTVYTFQPPDGRRSGAASPQISSQPVSPVCYEMEGVGPVNSLAVSQTATISRRSSRTSLHHALSSSSQESLNAGSKPKPPVPMRCSSLERPTVPEKKPGVKQQIQQQQQLLQSQQLKEQQLEALKFPVPSVVKASVPDFHKAAPDMVLPQPLYSNMSELKSDLVAPPLPNAVAGETNESDGSSSHASLGSSGYGSQPNMALDHTSRLEDCEASKYCTLRPHSLAVFPQSLIFPSQDFFTKGYVTSRTGSLRRGQKPPPPVRRTSSISSTSSLATSSFPSNNLLSGSVSNSSLTSSTSTVLSSPISNRSGKLSSSTSNVSNNNNNSGSNKPSSSPASQNSSTDDSSTNVSPLQKTDSESSTPVGSMENLPPPPAFLLEESQSGVGGNTVDPDSTTPEGVLCTPDCFAAPQKQRVEECIQKRKISVSDTIKSLQDSHHQPPSPVTHRRTQSLRMSAPPPLKKPSNGERRTSLEGPRAALISSLNAKLAISNPVLGTLMRQKSPMQQMIPIYSQPPPHIQKINVSPKLQRSKLSSVQEGVALGNSVQCAPPNLVLPPHAKEVSTFKGKPLNIHPHPPPPVPNDPPAKTPNPVPKTDNNVGDARPPSKRPPGNQDSFLQNLNMVLSQRTPPPPEPTSHLAPSSASPKTKHRKKSSSSSSAPQHPNGTPTAAAAASLQRSSSSASEAASKVRQWISSKKGTSASTSSEAPPASIRESLLDQIRKGAPLKRAKHVADRSAPRVH